MRRPAKVLLGVVTFAPLVWVLYLLVRFGSFLLRAVGNPVVSPVQLQELQQLLLLHLFAAGLMLLLLIGYGVHCARNRHLADGARIAWLLALLIGGAFVMPVYFALQLWPDRQPLPHPAD